MATRNARTNGKSAGDNAQLDPTFPEGGPTSSLTLSRDLAGGILGGGGIKNCFSFAVFLLFPGKNEKKTKQNKKNKKNAKKKKKTSETIWEDPPSRRGGPPKFPATFTTFPDGAAKSAKFPPNLAKVHVPGRLVTI